MAGNSFGKLFRITTFGESHGVAIGVIVDGCPAGLTIDEAFIQQELQRRKPGQSRITTQRKEEDVCQILSGVYEGVSTGTPISMVIFNSDQKSKDYNHLKEVYRPSHADFTYDAKYGFRDHRGGGRSSARETAARVAAGAIAKLFLKSVGVKVAAWVSSVGHIDLQKSYEDLNLDLVETNDIRCPDPDVAARMIEYIAEVKKQGDTVGGQISGLITGVVAGIGEPVFHKLHADLAHALMGINAAKGFEYGSGFSGASMRGSEHNDTFIQTENGVRTLTNHSGGIQGGISNGMDIYFKMAFKPIATLLRPQESINQKGESALVEGRGRHGPCVLPRAVPIVEAMSALVIADHYLLHRNSQL